MYLNLRDTCVYFFIKTYVADAHLNCFNDALSKGVNVGFQGEISKCVVKLEKVP